MPSSPTARAAALAALALWSCKAAPPAEPPPPPAGEVWLTDRQVADVNISS